MSPARTRLLLRVLEAVPAAMFLAVLLVFGSMSDRFLTVDNLTRILVQSSSTLVVAVGMTFVLLTGGVDLSVGAVMFVGAGIAGRMALAGHPPAVCVGVMLLAGLAGGVINAFLVTRCRLTAFIATLAMLYIGRGAGRWITETRAINMPDSFLAMGSSSWLGIPLPLWIAGMVVAVSQGVLSCTPSGRQLYALGAGEEAARKAGVRTSMLLVLAYVGCGLCAGLGGALALSQLGSVSPRFGELYEFDAITAAVLGGASLFGGRGRVFPGTVLGAVMIKSLFSGLVMVQADPYLYPLITGAVIFVAVLLDSLRTQIIRRLGRRMIFSDAVPGRPAGFEYRSAGYRDRE